MLNEILNTQVGPIGSILMISVPFLIVMFIFFRKIN